MTTPTELPTTQRLANALRGITGELTSSQWNTITEAAEFLRNLPLAAPALEPVAWQFRWTNPSGNPDVGPQEIDWKPLIPRSALMSIEDEVADLLAYRFDGKPCYEVRSMYAAPAPAKEGI